MLDDHCRVSGKGATESYEKSHTKLKDKVFHKFTKRLAKCPEQILRYSWGGEALPISPCDSSISCCPSCGAHRQFELQLMPGLIPSLTSTSKSGLIEFGTVIVYSCSQSCWK